MFFCSSSCDLLGVRPLLDSQVQCIIVLSDSSLCAEMALWLILAAGPIGAALGTHRDSHVESLPAAFTPGGEGNICQVTPGRTDGLLCFFFSFGSYFKSGLVAVMS